jgi:hypothetical protein
MKLDDLELFAYLHDSTVLSVLYEIDISGTRTLAFTVQCHPDVGYPLWNGRTLQVLATYVLLFRCNAWGYTSNKEEIDSWREGVSKETRASLGKLEEAGVSVPHHLFTVSLQSGSVLEFACHDIAVNEVELDS